METLENLRKDINWLDEELLSLLQKRMKLTHEVWVLKKENNQKIYDPDREESIFAILRKNEKKDPEWIISLWRELMYLSKRDQNKILSQKQDETIRIGIQWGRGSFNEIAIQDFLEKNREVWAGKNIEIIYLYTTHMVLESLNNGSIDVWIFAIANSIGWLVGETLDVLGTYRWKLIATHEIEIQHSLLIHPDRNISDISEIMWHDQAIRQCVKHLETDFPWIPYKAGNWELTDNAAIARAVGNGSLPKNTGSIGHRSLADIYGLKVAKENLQDRDDNRTTFCIVWIDNILTQ